MTPDCAFCGHSMRSHNTRQFDGPVCLLCGCGDQYVVDDNPVVVHKQVSVWRELGIVTVIALVIMGAILLAIWWMERMVLPGGGPW